ncbi:MAG: PleD family two-component system response regulator [Bdellovibrionales bacterium]
MSKKINTRDLVEKIEKVTRERIAKTEVVSLDAFRHLKKAEDPATVLIVDDDESIRLSLKRLFEDEGHRVLVAADGTQLTNVLDGNPIHLIILDVGLPWINGFELAQMMKEHDDLKNIPIIFVSAHREDRDVKKGFEVGASDYIKKPFDLQQLRKTVQTLLQLNK